MSVAIIQQRLRAEGLYRNIDLNRTETKESTDKKPKETFEAFTARREKHERIRGFKNNLRINDLIAALTGVLGMVFGAVEYETYYDDTDKGHFTETSTTNGLRVVVSLTSLLLVICVWIHAIFSYKIEREKKSFEIVHIFWKSKHFRRFLIEFLVVLVHSPLGFNYTFDFEQYGTILKYSVDTITTQILYLRIYLVFRAWSHYSEWNSDIMNECCEAEGCEAGSLFALKANFKERPYTTLLIIMFLSIALFGLALRGFERPYYYGMDPSTSGFQDYSFAWNGMWCITITMTTGIVNY